MLSTPLADALLNAAKMRLDNGAPQPPEGGAGYPTQLRSARQQEEREEYEERVVRDYEGNLSHTRNCSSQKAQIQQLKPLIVPELKLAFCYIPKNACTAFKDLINLLNKLDDPWMGFGWGYLDSTAAMLGVDPATIVKENGWKFATFTRDPALRYLSAWGSTCVSENNHASYEHWWECCGPLVKDNTIAPQKIANMFHERLDYDVAHGLIEYNQHWSQQVQMLQNCGWEQFGPKKVDFLGDLSTGDVNMQVKEMLSLNGPIQAWQEELVDRFFPEERVYGHTSPLNNTPPETFFNDVRTIEALMKLYEDDFEHIPRVGQGFTSPRLEKVKR
uniref:Uncharacterized protein n=1 Tax=Alexandrium catenella TaxID=2925 RepID=A0A7S1RD16_ALECA